MNIVFLDADKIGLILPAFQKCELGSTKRHRQMALNTFIKTLKGLGLVHAGREIVSVSLGLQLDGSRGLFIISREMETKVLGQTGPGDLKPQGEKA